MAYQIKKAERTGVRTMTTFYGQSGSGKSLSALLYARGLVGMQGRIGVIDTESGRSRLYADQVPGGFDVIDLSAPFNADAYIGALRAFEAAHYDVIVFDSASHEWDGDGGVLEFADREEQARKFGKLKWLRPKLDHKRFMNALLQCKSHLVISLRAKEILDEVPDPRRPGKMTYVSRGWSEIQEKNFIYESTISMHTENGGYPVIKKCPNFLQAAFKPDARISVETGAEVIRLLGPQGAIDWGADDLRRAGTEAAEQGLVALEAWWKTLSKDQKKAGQKVVAETLKPMAIEVDRLAADEQAVAAEAADVEDPFGTKQAA